MKTLLAIACFSIFINSYSQQDKILEIREYYYSVKKTIESQTPDSAWTYYSDQIIRNRQDLPWRAIGIFHDTITFWYSDLMSAAMENDTEGDSTDALVLVTSSAQLSMMFIYREWLFLEGNLIFYYDRMIGYDEDSTWEYRYYFDNNKLIRFMQGNQIISYDDDPNEILQFGEEIKSLFNTIINL
ncbi:hypothetical protein SDC9_46023 [bioreactor metagenome]|uniref:Uncharacterized protein n=1 Tax=bioreactor metagenome TaxID=1076179 RepID=A0A644WB68_9ZZZZ